MQKVIAISGECPYLQKSHTATASYEKILLAGDNTEYAKCVGFSCNYSDECTCRDNCTLLASAQKINQW